MSAGHQCNRKFGESAVRFGTMTYSGPIILPRHMPMKTTAEVHFFLVSPAVLDACQL